MMSAGRKSSTNLHPGQQRQQKFSLNVWPVQKTSIVSTASPENRRNLSINSATSKIMGQKRTVNFPETDAVDSARMEIARIPSPRLVSTPILGAVHLISKRLEVARRAQKRRRSLEREPMTDFSVSSSENDICGVKGENGSARRCSR